MQAAFVLPMGNMSKIHAITLLPALLLLAAIFSTTSNAAVVERDDGSSANELRFVYPTGGSDNREDWRDYVRQQRIHTMQQHREKAKSWTTPPENSRDQLVKASILYKGGKFTIVPNKWAASNIAYGMVAKTLNTTGWDVLDVGTKASTHNDTATMYAAGLLEGYLTADRISLMYRNMMAQFFPTEHSRNVLLPRVRSFLLRQFDWAKKYAAANPHSAVARNTGYILAQLQGLIQGYLASNDTTVVRDPFVLHLLNAVGDMIDLQTALNDTGAEFFDRMTHSEFRDFVHKTGHCSALIRVTPGLEKIFMGHSSWFTYSATLRIYKHYFLNLEDRDVASRSISFSSYPGFLESLDDFYILDSAMVVLQTTNNVFNLSLYKAVKPESLLAWQRVRVANQIARNGSHWGWIMNQHNSGTYNNQYMIINLKRIKPNVSIDDGALTIAEQIPTLVMYSDQTKILRTGYFASYNVPFFERIYNMSGYPDVVKKRGLDFSYQMAPRAKIFRRQAPQVFATGDMGAVLRFNQYTDDPYSEGDACNSICCRGDLRNGTGAAPFGCYDSKFTEFKLARHLVSFAISGPSRGSKDHRLPAFAWKKFPNASHAGLPPVYNFNWVAMKPRTMRWPVVVEN